MKGPRSIDKKYQKITWKDQPIQNFLEKAQIRNLFLELTGFLSPYQCSLSQPLFQSIENSPSLDVLNHWIPDSQTEALLVEQIYAPGEKSKDIYSFE